MTSYLERVGIASFLVGALISILSGISEFQEPIQHYIIAVLGILGVVVGFLNINDKEITSFLISVVALIIAFSTLKTVLVTINFFGIGDFFSRMISNLIVFMSPAAVVVALKELYSVAAQK